MLARWLKASTATTGTIQLTVINLFMFYFAAGIESVAIFRKVIYNDTNTVDIICLAETAG